MLQTLDAIVRSRGLVRVVEPPGDRLVERVDQQGRLAAAGNAGDAAENTNRNFGGDVLEIIAAGIDDADHPPLIDATALRNVDAEHSGQILSGQRIRRRHDVRRRALGNDVAAMNPGARADIDDVVGAADRILIVLDHDHGVAEIAEPFECFEQAGIVALMQPDRRLVEHVKHASQAGADLRREADALAFSTRQGS